MKAIWILLCVAILLNLGVAIVGLGFWVGTSVAILMVCLILANNWIIAKAKEDLNEDSSNKIDISEDEY